jgi:hypothetical protein
VSSERIKEIANAILYEGYLLYPYRHSAIKNRQRWTFGAIYPRAYSEANGDLEPCRMQTECLVVGPDHSAALDVTVRFLHLLECSVERAEHGAINLDDWNAASRLDARRWEEGMEREVSVSALSLSELADHPWQVEINFPGVRIVEDATDGSTVREQRPLVGTISIMAERKSEAGKQGDLFKVSIVIENSTPGTDRITNRRDAIMLQSFISTHTILQVRQGAFISLLETPDAWQPVVQECRNIGTWPVLVGNEGDCDAMLSSPIILYDYPQIAPESPGALFDGTEIDELLTLRIMTLTEEEKQEMLQSDSRAREILERTETLTPEQFMKLHGAIRSLRPITGEDGV